jgi:hypothetical protein
MMARQSRTGGLAEGRNCASIAGCASQGASMKHLIALSGIALALTLSPLALAQSPPPLPELTQQQADDVNERIDAYRRATDARVARGEITADEADRLLKWREWQLAQQAAASAPVVSARVPVDSDVPPDYHGSAPPDYYRSPPPAYYRSSPPDYYVVEPAPLYAPYYRYPAPRYVGPAPYAYWGPSICAGGFGRHFGGRICF